MSISKLSFLPFLTLCACVGTQAQRPVQMSVQTSRHQALPTLRAALAENGHETEYLDNEAGIIHTRWVDTGFMHGSVQGETATIVRRYTIVVTDQSNGSASLLLRADAKKCAQYGFQIAGETITGACETMSELVPDHQSELDSLGIKLRTRLGGAQS